MTDTRIQVRVTPEEREKFKEMARLCGFKMLSEFMRVAAYEKAKRDLTANELRELEII